MIRFLKIAFLSFTLFFLGCDYKILWTDGAHKVLLIDIENPKLCYDLGERGFKGGFICRVDAVVEVGSNERFIATKSCSDSGCSYYYLEKSLDDGFIDKKELVKGPYSDKEYEAKRAISGLPKTKELIR